MIFRVELSRFNQVFLLFFIFYKIVRNIKFKFKSVLLRNCYCLFGFSVVLVSQCSQHRDGQQQNVPVGEYFMGSQATLCPGGQFS
jgi:hypothetical protein